MNQQKSDFFIFGATSDVIQQLFVDERAWFLANIRRLILVQRNRDIAPAYAGFETHIAHADASDAHAFRKELEQIVNQYASKDTPLHVFPTYGSFHMQNKPRPHFTFTDDGLQINLNSRLQIIDVFRDFHTHTRFHMFGSLLGSFPYAGDYAMSMWYMNQLPKHPEYAHLDLRIYNLGGMKTKFWDHTQDSKDNPFVHKTIPTAWLREKMAGTERGVFDCFPTLTARIGCTLGRRGARML